MKKIYTLKGFALAWAREHEKDDVTEENLKDHPVYERVRWWAKSGHLPTMALSEALEMRWPRRQRHLLELLPLDEIGDWRVTGADPTTFRPPAMGPRSTKKKPGG